VRSRSFPFQWAILPSDAEGPAPSPRDASSSRGGNSGAGSISGTRTGLEGGGSLPTHREGSGRMFSIRARRMSSPKRNAASSSRWLAPTRTAVERSMGAAPVRPVVSNTTISPLRTRLRMLWPSSVTAVGSMLSTNQHPTQECPSFTSTTGWRLACSRHDVTSMVRSRQVPRRPDKIRSASRIFCPSTPNEAGGVLYTRCSAAIAL
jgi:hypothetical protein